MKYKKFRVSFDDVYLQNWFSYRTFYGSSAEQIFYESGTTVDDLHYYFVLDSGESHFFNPYPQITRELI